ncbi:MAG: hypothetical protein KAR54_01005 [Candidatus Pacebacteria bacterium]|nr:hypothetical protein [Candidatus Paceibacterota bacterium]
MNRKSLATTFLIGFCLMITGCSSIEVQIPFSLIIDNNYDKEIEVVLVSESGDENSFPIDPVFVSINEIDELWKSFSVFVSNGKSTKLIFRGSTPHGGQKIVTVNSLSFEEEKIVSVPVVRVQKKQKRISAGESVGNSFAASIGFGAKALMLQQKQSFCRRYPENESCQ